MTDCQCNGAGWCERHQCQKTERHVYLCKTNKKYFDLWENGRGPGQKIKKKPFVPQPQTGRVKWVTVADLAQATLSIIHKIPSDVTRVVAIPRSGMLPASIIATQLHLPLYTVRDFQVEPVGGGSRVGFKIHDKEDRRWLFVDDTVHSGFSLERLRRGGVPIDEHITCCVYAKDVGLCDVSAEHLPTPHLLEWNLMNTPWMKHNATDMDGVVCHNPPRQCDPLYVPRHSAIKAIISARPEKERQQTQTWLVQQRAKYEQLILWNGTESDRWDVEKVGKWKADECKRVGIGFYVESEPSLADAIRKHGVSVLCPKQGFME